EPQPQDYEAGPDVVQFPKSDFFPTEAYFKDPSDFDLLQKIGLIDFLDSPL
ncbi:hypothetical protein HPB47_027572, partial [Ixodes persulcatus]